MDDRLSSVYSKDNDYGQLAKRLAEKVRYLMLTLEKELVKGALHVADGYISNLRLSRFL